MTFLAAHVYSEGYFPFVLTDQSHGGGLANDAHGRGDRQAEGILQQFTQTNATDFLIARKCQMNRRVQRLAYKARHGRQYGCDEPFHIRTAPAIQAAIATVKPERISGPFLSVYRNNIGVASQQKSRTTGRSDACEEGGFRVGPVFHQAAIYPVPCQVIPNKVDQLEIGKSTGGIEGNQLGEEGFRIPSFHFHGLRDFPRQRQSARYPNTQSNLHQSALSFCMMIGCECAT